MTKKIITLNDKNLIYDLQRKNVRNINLRVKADGTVCVSANRWVPQRTIDAFLQAKASFVLSTLNKYEKRSALVKKQYFTEEEIKDVILDLCKKVYPYFAKLGVEYPEIKFRKMVSQWGNCRSDRGILTFNTNLMYAPHECIEYVVLHEFTHFLVANHSAEFYTELAKVCPDWKTLKGQLKEIVLR